MISFFSSHITKIETSCREQEGGEMGAAFPQGSCPNRYVDYVMIYKSEYKFPKKSSNEASVWSLKMSSLKTTQFSGNLNKR